MPGWSNASSPTRTGSPRSPDLAAQRLHAALLWAGAGAAAAGRSAGAEYGLEGVSSDDPEIVVPRTMQKRHQSVVVSRTDRRAALMIRRYHGVHVTGVEATIVRLAHLLDGESLEVAFEHARRRQLTSTQAIHAYLDRHAKAGQPGVATLRALLEELDPKHPSRSTLEVKTRRLLVAHGITDFVREHPLEGERRRYYFDFGFLDHRTILETNGKRWHDDPVDYEYNNEKWSVPGQLGFKLVFATWAKVTERPAAFIQELRTTLAA